MTALIPNTRLSHGTIECEDCLTSRKFYQEILGLGSVRPLAEAQYLWQGGPWSLVCVAIGDKPKPQTPENRFCLRVTTAAEVEAAHAAAHNARHAHAIQQITNITESNGVRSFLIHDRDNVWWEIANTTPTHYDEAFARGDIT
jgi:catechol-2,3-dioxygenase